MRRHKRKAGDHSPQPGEMACREKTARKNVYHNKKYAKMMASQMRRRTGDNIDWFRCTFCGLYHLGRESTQQEKVEAYLDHVADRLAASMVLAARDHKLEYYAMANLNKVQLIGRLGRDPEIKVFTGGGKVANISICVNNRAKNQQTGEWEDVPVWVYCKAFNREQGRKLADIFEQYTHKGDQVYIEGRLTLEEWVDKNSGEKRTALKVIVEDIQLLERKPQGGGSGGHQGGHQEGQGEYQEENQARPQGGSQVRQQGSQQGGQRANGQSHQPATARPASQEGGDTYVQEGGGDDNEIPF